MSTTSAHDDSPSPLLPLAHQVAHNLEYQQRWTAIATHTTSPLTGEPLARPLVSGMPPRRVYVHPDEQIEMLRRAKQEREKGERNGPAGRQPVRTTDATASDEAIWEPKPQREWVLPTDLREEWTLRRLAAVFAGIGPIPPRLESSGEGQQADDEDEAKWRATKRLLLAAIQSDSTIVYYVVHDGIVKPRTN